MNDNRKASQNGKGSTGTDRTGASGDRDLGHALRSVYAKTVSEDIPQELLDLLGKLR